VTQKAKSDVRSTMDDHYPDQGFFMEELQEVSITKHSLGGVLADVGPSDCFLIFAVFVVFR